MIYVHLGATIDAWKSDWNQLFNIIVNDILRVFHLFLFLSFSLHFSNSSLHIFPFLQVHVSPKLCLLFLFTSPLGFPSLHFPSLTISVLWSMCSARHLMECEGKNTNRRHWRWRSDALHPQSPSECLLCLKSFTDGSRGKNEGILPFLLHCTPSAIKILSPLWLCFWSVMMEVNLTGYRKTQLIFG